MTSLFLNNGSTDGNFTTASFNMVKLDGGPGMDMLTFGSYTDGSDLTLRGGAVIGLEERAQILERR